MSRKFTEQTRVQIPALVHLTRLGYKYLGEIATGDYDPETNILLGVFREQFAKLNPENSNNVEEVLRAIKRELDNDDLGKSFYDRLTGASNGKLVDFDEPGNNVFHYTEEFTCKGEHGKSFRPDITLFVNGLPLVFVELKIPNNTHGVVAEKKRMNEARFGTREFRRFINVTQLMIFSNNMEYDDEEGTGITPSRGAFYCTGAQKGGASFNRFREEQPGDIEICSVDRDVERKIMESYNCCEMLNQSGYKTNIDPSTPTNRILSSMCSPKRLIFLLKYGIAYVSSYREEGDKLVFYYQKHIMRYQQMFAALAVREKLSEGIKSGIIWHTQGSGKTALAFYLTRILTDFYFKRRTSVKFYFIVDRLDLLNQAKREFKARGLSVNTPNHDRLIEEFGDDDTSVYDSQGERKITVVNIHKFGNDESDDDADTTEVKQPLYNTKLQRIFFVDEAHRSYSPTGSFLANLLEADPNSIKIALTGTPLLKDEKASWKIFGDYIHVYYYDRSIKDGYTLMIKRDDIETKYKEKMEKIYKDLENLLVAEKDVKKACIVEHDSYVKELFNYIVDDMKNFREINGDSENTLGGMVICETSKQAKKLFDKFQEGNSGLTAGLVLYDSENIEETIGKFKNEPHKVDILIVFRMLQTGFDSPRLKRLYVGRKLEGHNLLQAITRVNRPYKDNKYGYVVDFADIKKNFDETNEAYLKELNRFKYPDGNAQGEGVYSHILATADIDEIKKAYQVAFNYVAGNNLELLERTISKIKDKDELLRLKNALAILRDNYNIFRVTKDDNLKAEFEKIKVSNVPDMLAIVERRIRFINDLTDKGNDALTMRLLDEVLNNIEFRFVSNPTDSGELKFMYGEFEEFQKKVKRVRSKIEENQDKEDPEYITLLEAFNRMLERLEFKSIEEYEDVSNSLDDVIRKIEVLERRNDALMAEYNDFKFVRVHKRIQEKNTRRESIGEEPIISKYDNDIIGVLRPIKISIDKTLYDNDNILNNYGYFDKLVKREVVVQMDKFNSSSKDEDNKILKDIIAEQYLEHYATTV